MKKLYYYCLIQSIAVISIYAMEDLSTIKKMSDRWAKKDWLCSAQTFTLYTEKREQMTVSWSYQTNSFKIITQDGKGNRFRINDYMESEENSALFQRLKNIFEEKYNQDNNTLTDIIKELEIMHTRKMPKAFAVNIVNPPEYHLFDDEAA